MIDIRTPEGINICSATITRTGLLVLVILNSLIYVNDLQSKDPGISVNEMPFFDISIASLGCSPDGQELALGTTGGTVCLWGLRSNESTVIKLEGHKGMVASVAYSLCSKWILSGGYDKTVRIWGYQKGKVDNRSCVAVVVAGYSTISSVSWNPVELKEFVTGCKGGSVRVWRVLSGDDGGDVSVQILWGNNVGLLGVSDLTFKGAIGLSPIHKKLLVQRGAIEDSSPVKEGGAIEE
ncbi:Target of rapamycin complex subunit lst8 [Linnemannia zychae]|nr:Target of rapamycin complex subunit lst8 [Linnemannia zychae]